MSTDIEIIRDVFTNRDRRVLDRLELERGFVSKFTEMQRLEICVRLLTVALNFLHPEFCVRNLSIEENRELFSLVEQYISHFKW